MPDQFHPFMDGDGKVTLPADGRPASLDSVLSSLADTTGAPAPEQPQAPPQPPAPAPDNVTGAQAAPQQQAVPVPVSPDDVISFSRKNFAQEFNRFFMADDEKRSDILATVGRRNRREWDLERTKLTAEVARLQRELEDVQFKALPPDKIAEQTTADPGGFGQRYMEYLARSKNPQQAQAQAEQERVFEAERAYFQQQADDLYEEALALDIHPQRLAQYKGEFGGCSLHDQRDASGNRLYGTAGHSYYDHDESGVMYIDRLGDPALARNAAFNRFTGLLRNEISQTRAIKQMQQPRQQPQQAQQQEPQQPQQSAAQAAAQAAQAITGQQPQAQQPTGKGDVVAMSADRFAQQFQAQEKPRFGAPNPALSASPDMSTGQGPAAGQGRYQFTQAEVAAMSWEERIAAFPAGAYERGIAEGRIEPPPGIDPQVLQLAQAVAAQTQGKRF